MKFDNKLNDELTEIIKYLKENTPESIESSKLLFKEHLKKIITIGRFSKDVWLNSWRKNVYEFGTLFKKIDPIDFLNIITSEKNGKNKDEQEVLDFYYSEIEVNSLPEETCTSRFESLISKYPYNPEFRHTLGHFFVHKNEYEKAIQQYNFARNKDINSESFKKSLFVCYKLYLETLIENSEYEKGLEITKDLIDSKVFWGGMFMHNYIISLNERFKDYILLNKKISDAESTIREIVSNETQKGQIKIIEILGFFTAIIAFIFSTVSIGKQFSFNEAIIFNISLGLTLLAFTIMINLFVSNKKIETFDYRILLFIIVLISLLLIVSKFGISIWL